MKNLQQFLDNKTDDELDNLLAMLEKEKLSPEETVSLLNMMQEVHVGETGKQMNDGELVELAKRFQFAISMYVNVRHARMTVKGQIMLTSDNCSFSLTKRGEEYVESMMRRK